MKKPKPLRVETIRVRMTTEERAAAEAAAEAVGMTLSAWARVAIRDMVKLSPSLSQWRSR